MPNYTRVYMDVWSLDELKSCREVMWPEMPIGEMIERYDRCIVTLYIARGIHHHLQTVLLANIHAIRCPFCLDPSSA